MTQPTIKLNSATSWLQFAVVFLTGITIAMGMFKVPVHMPNIMGEFGVSITEAGLLMSVVGFTCIFTAIPAGAVMQKLGPKTFGIIVVASGIIENVIGAIAPNFWVLLGTRFLEGISYGCMSMVSVAIVSAYFTTEKRGLPNGIWVIWVSVAQLIVAQLANLLVPSFGWRGEWVAIAVIQAVLLVAFIAFVKDPRRVGLDTVGEDVSEGANAQSTQVPQEKVSVLDGLKEPAVWLFSASLCCVAVGCGCLTGLYPTYLQTGLGLDPATANNIVSLGTLGGIVGSVAVGWVINRTKVRNRGILLCVVAVISIVCFSFQFSMTAAIVAPFIIFYTAVTQFNMPVGFALVPDAIKRPQVLSMAIGVLMIGANLGGALSTTLPSMFVDAAGGDWGACVPMVVGFAIASLVFAILGSVYMRRKVLPVRPDVADR